MCRLMNGKEVSGLVAMRKDSLKIRCRLMSDVAHSLLVYI